MNIRDENIKGKRSIKSVQRLRYIRQFLFTFFSVLIHFGFAVIISIILVVSAMVTTDETVLSETMKSYKGYSFQTIISESMTPTLNVSDLIIIKKYDRYNKGDIITYYHQLDDGSWRSYTHRIVAIGNGYYRTQGDANNDWDEWNVYKENIVGKVEKNIPYVGKITLKIGKIPLVAYKIFAITIIIAYGIYLIYDIIKTANTDPTKEEIKAVRLKEHKQKHRKLKFNIKRLNLSRHFKKKNEKKEISMKNE